MSTHTIHRFLVLSNYRVWASPLALMLLGNGVRSMVSLGLSGVMKFDRVRSWSRCLRYFELTLSVDGYEVEHGGLCTTVSSIFILLFSSAILTLYAQVFSAPNYGKLPFVFYLLVFNPSTQWTKRETKAPSWVLSSQYLLSERSHFVYIRIDSAGTQEYTQFEATPHPPMKPMAYVNGGLGSMMMWVYSVLVCIAVRAMFGLIITVST